MQRIFFLFVFCLSYGLQAQNSQLKAIDSIEFDADEFVGIDKFQNVYYIKNNTLFKKPENEDSIAYQDFQLGDITRVDILNPNKISVFYKPSNVVVILDNRMTEIDRQDFNLASPFKNVGFAGTSKDQGLWIYNVDLNQLELYDYRFDRTLAKSLPIDEEILDMKNNFNLSYLKTPEGIRIFNIYGSLVKEIVLPGIKSFDLYKNKLLAHVDNRIVIFDKDFQIINTIKVDFEAYENLFYTDEKIYIYDEKKLTEHLITTKN